jgi:hypothetical protein
MNNKLCSLVKTLPSGVNSRKWTLRNDNQSHYHGVVSIEETPLYIDFSWRQTADDPIMYIGLFCLDLPGLLQGGFIRWEPANSPGSMLRLRIIRDNDGKFYIQVNSKSPRLQMS